MPPSTKGNEPEILTLKGNINIQAGSFEPCILPLAILPLKFRLRCSEYQLAEENQTLRLCCDKAISGSKINFEVLNYFIYSHFVLAVEIESLEENEAKQPDVIIDKIMKGFTISIPKVEEPTRCQNLTTVIHCDFVIMPLVFEFEIYDFISKRFESSSCQIMFIPGSTRTLYFRMTSLFRLNKKDKSHIAFHNQ